MSSCSPRKLSVSPLLSSLSSLHVPLSSRSFAARSRLLKVQGVQAPHVQKGGALEKQRRADNDGDALRAAPPRPSQNLPPLLSTATSAATRAARRTHPHLPLLPTLAPLRSPNHAKRAAPTSLPSPAPRAVAALAQVGDGADFVEGVRSRTSTCYKCGRAGHWAADCPGIEAASDDEAPAAPFSTHLQVSCRPAAEQTLAPPRPPSPPPAADPEARERALEVAAAATDEDLVGALQRHFGHSHFRGKQLETVRALLHGDSCISIMPTGQGKSLCFQLPALLLPGLTLVVTPLIALMLDQVASAPKELLPAALWSGQTRAQALEVLDGIRVRLRVRRGGRGHGRQRRNASPTTGAATRLSPRDGAAVGGWPHGPATRPGRRCPALATLLSGPRKPQRAWVHARSPPPPPHTHTSSRDLRRPARTGCCS